MNHQAKIFVRNIRWAVCIFLSQDKSKDKEKKERYGFNSQKNPDPQPLVEPFVDEVYDVIKNIKFKQKTNEFQKQFKEKTINKIEECDKLLIKGDKSNNFYETTVEDYDKVVIREIQKDYKKAQKEEFKNVTKQDKKIAQKMDIEDRVFQTTPVPAFVTIKDHKPNFENLLPARLINGTKQNLGRASKQILEKIVTNLREQTKLNQWKKLLQCYNGL